MKKKNKQGKIQPEHYVLLIAFLVVSAIFTFTLITSKSISVLQQSNRNTRNSFLLKDKVQALLADVLLMETQQRGMVLYNDNDPAQPASDYMVNVEKDLTELKPLINEDFSKEYQQLYFFALRKIKFNKLVLDAYEKRGKAEAEGIISTQIGDQLRDSIYMYAKRLEHEFGRNVQANLDANYNKSTRIQPITTILSAISVLAIVVLSWLILYRINQKNMLIKSLRKAHRREIKAKNELEIAKREAESSAIVKENFLANMSHEIRTPINAVLGFSKILQKGKLSQEQKKFVDLIQSSGASLLSIVNDILDISKIEAGMMRIEEVNFSLRGICDSVLTMFANQANEKKISIGLSIEDRCADALIGDPLRLTQILINLLSNALKFTAAGSIQLKVMCMRTEAGKSRLCFTVEDTGIGMDADKLERIFNRFDQGDNETTRKFGGTGLGLAIVKNLVELQGGIIYVESTPGKGSRFIFEIPFLLQQEGLKPSIKTETAPVLIQTKAHILVAEDNEVNQLLIEYILKEWGLQFTMVNNGKEAVDIMRTEKFDLILMDIQMPEIDGYKATGMIRQEINASVPIIAMTAHALPGEQEKCLEAGMNGYISKPVNEEKLRAELLKYIKNDKNDLSGELPVIDQEYLGRKFSNNPDFISKIAAKVAEQFPEELRQLHHAISQKNKDAVITTAHKMRTTVSIVRKESLQSQWLEHIEMMAASEDTEWNELEKLYQQLEASGVLLQKEVTDLINTIRLAV